MAQGPHGDLWLGTVLAVPVRRAWLERFVASGGEALKSTNVTALEIRAVGILVDRLLRVGGISLLRDGRLTHFEVRDGVPPGMVLAFESDAQEIFRAPHEAGFRLL